MKKKILIIGTIWPEPDSTAAGMRMLQLLEIFRKMNYEISFSSVAAKSEFSYNLENLDIHLVPIVLNDASFDVFIQNLLPDVVLFDRFLTEEQFGWRVAKYSPNSLLILDTEDLHFLRENRQICYKKNAPFIEKIISSDLAKREVASIYRCDISLIISKYEHQYLIEKYNIPENILLYIPFLTEEITENEIDKMPTFEDRNHFMTIGNFLHAPNVASVEILKTKIWPPIKKALPNAELHIYGAYPSAKIIEMHNEKEGILIKGRAKSSEEVFCKSKICLAPIPFGAGLKGKLLEAMQFGTPSITTTIGAEGMHLNEQWNGFYSDDYEAIIENATLLYQNKNKWEEAQRNGYKIVNSSFLKTTFAPLFIEKINSCLENIENHRKQNFIGQLLQHHTLKSTMYMSKWIEEKNKFT